MEKAEFYSYWKRRLLWVWIFLLCAHYFSQNYHLLTNEMPYPLSWYSTHHRFWSRNPPSWPRTCSSGPCSWNPLVFPCSPLSSGSWLESGTERPWEDLVTGKPGGSALRGWSKVLEKVAYAPNSTKYGTSSPTARIRRSGNRGAEMGRAPLAIAPTDPQTKVLLPVPSALCSAGLEILLPEERILLPADTTMVLLSQKLSLLSRHFGLLMPLKQQARKGDPALAGATDPELKGKRGYSSTVRVGKSMFGT